MAPDASSNGGDASAGTVHSPHRRGQTPATPGVWAVSHRDIDRAQAGIRETAGTRASFELVTDVSFVWSYPANSAFVTGTFSNWETTVPMTQTSGMDGPIWVLTKALPPGDYQYKFIIDNVWRHAPDQPIVLDERGIINNELVVTVESCGDITCFCSSVSAGGPPSAQETSEEPDAEAGLITPRTIKKIQRNVGVAYRYVEKDRAPNARFRKAYMHTEISDRPFDCTVVNVKNLPMGRNYIDYHLADGTISRASSFENIFEDTTRLRYDPNVPVVEDAYYAATLNDEIGSLPHTAANRAHAHSSDPTELAYSVRARLSSSNLGFNPNECHEGIRLTDTNHCAVRVQDRGLYKSVRAVLPVRTDSHRVYYEFFVFRQATGGGVCIGLSTHELPLNCLCGTRPNSIGFSTSGYLIKTVDGKETWTAFGEDLGSGNTIGCLVGLSKQKNHANPSKSIIHAKIEFFVDGCSRGVVKYDFVGDLQVFPTLSLFARHARVYSLFDGHDMLFATCLPEGEEVLTLDEQRIRRDSGNTPQSLGLAADEKNL